MLKSKIKTKCITINYVDRLTLSKFLRKIGSRYTIALADSLHSGMYMAHLSASNKSYEWRREHRHSKFNIGNYVKQGFYEDEGKIEYLSLTKNSYFAFELSMRGYRLEVCGTFIKLFFDTIKKQADKSRQLTYFEDFSNMLNRHFYSNFKTSS